jgi:hypothetical protein
MSMMGTGPEIAGTVRLAARRAQWTAYHREVTNKILPATHM